MLALPGRRPRWSLAAHPAYVTYIEAPRVSKNGDSALVTFQVPGNVTNID